jgi:hypothetical protein
MTITAQNVIDQGYAKSAAARPDSMVATGELVTRIGQALREAFQIISRENPLQVGTTLAVAFDGTGWPRPTNCIRVIKLAANSGTIATPAIAVGAEIRIVPFDDQQICLGQPSVTELGQRYLPTGQGLDPSGGTVTMTYARAPIVPAAVTDAIDSLFPDWFIEFLNWDMAAYLAYKDMRQEDEQTFLAMKNAILQQIVEWVRSGSAYNMVQRFPLVTPPTTNMDGGRQDKTATDGSQ